MYSYQLLRIKSKLLRKKTILWFDSFEKCWNVSLFPCNDHLLICFPYFWDHTFYILYNTALKYAVYILQWLLHNAPPNWCLHERKILFLSMKSFRAWCLLCRSRFWANRNLGVERNHLVISSVVINCFSRFRPAWWLARRETLSSTMIETNSTNQQLLKVSWTVIWPRNTRLTFRCDSECCGERQVPSLRAMAAREWSKDS